MPTKIEWATETWNPVTGCSAVSEGCEHCYARRMAKRLRGRYGYPEDEPFRVTVHPDRLKQPSRWRKPRMIFVCSMGDLFHDGIPRDFIDRVFAVAALRSRHVFLMLTKRPRRMLEYMSDDNTPFRVAKMMDALKKSPKLIEEIKPISGYPGYFASTKGVIYSQKRGPRRVMRPDVGKQGHQRVQLHRDKGGPRGERLLVHRLILETFVGPPPRENMQGCHLDGNPSNNTVTNLVWGDQATNWRDSKRHGTHRRSFKLTQEEVGVIRSRWSTGESAAGIARDYNVSDTQVRNIGRGEQWNIRPPISWPLSSVWLGVTAENQKRADERIPVLLQIPTAVRFVSVEPMLSAVDLKRFLLPGFEDVKGIYKDDWKPRHRWVICGAETGPGKRLMKTGWAKELRDQCVEAKVPFFFKRDSFGSRLLDGREWNEMPEKE